MSDKHPRLAELDERIEAVYREVLTGPYAQKFFTSKAVRDRRAYAIYLINVFHYTRHTPRNQGLVGVNLANTNLVYMRYCFEHALEEVGHEQMAVHDLRSIGVPIEDPLTDLPPPLPATELLIAYLYWVSTQGNPVGRLGYSYWAERAYGHGTRFLDAMQAGMGLTRKNMTFFYVHKEIDAKHADDVERAIVAACRTEEDWQRVGRVAEVTLRTTLQMLEQAFEAFEAIDRDEPHAYAFLNSIPRG